MQATVAKLDKNRVQLQVEVASEEVDQALVEASRRLAQRVSIPGFRRGRVPRTVLERHLGKKSLYEEAVEILFPKAYHQAVLEKELEPIDQPELELIQLEEGKPFIFRVTVAVKPEVKLGQYKGLKAVRRVHPVTDQDVKRVLTQLQERQAELSSVEREEVQKGDFVLLDFDGFLDGRPFKGGAGREVLVEVGSGRFIPGFEEQLIGALRGKEREVAVTFPSDYPNSELAGKEAVFKVVVREIKKKVLPEINDEFARDVGDFSDLAELKARIRENLAAERARLEELEVTEQLVAAVTAAAEVDVPDVLVERRLERKVRDLTLELAHRGHSLEDFLGPGRSEEDLKTELRPGAEEEVKRALVLEAIAKAEGIEATSEEVDRRIARLMGLEEKNEKNAAAVKEMRQRLLQEGRLESVVNQVRIDKVLDFLVQSAEIEEKAVEGAEAKQQGEGEGER